MAVYIQELKGLETFTGEIRDVEAVLDWVWHAKLALDLLPPEIKEEQKISLIKMKMKNRAALWARAVTAEAHKNNAKTFLEVLLQAYITDQDRECASDQFLSLKQGSMLAMKYFEKMVKLARICAMPDNIIRGMFINGLHPKIRTYVKLQAPPEEAYIALCHTEHAEDIV